MLPKDSSEALSASERRRADRKKLIVDVNFHGGDATGIANTRDIGIGGLYMTTDARMKIGTPLLMRMTIGGREVEINGVVAYIDDGQGAGIRFLDLPGDVEELLKKELDVE